MPAIQLALPQFDTRPICPGCKRPANLLAQWSPGDRVYLCRQCHESHPAPDIFVLNQNSRGVGLRQSDDDETRRARERYHDLVNSLDRMRRGCVYSLRDKQTGRGLDCERGGHEGYWNCKLCVKEAKKAPRYSSYNRGVAVLKFAQMSLPQCKRCGCVHDNKYTHVDDYHTYCQRCDGEMAVESFWNHRGIFGGDDDESIMDRIQRSHPHLFEMGILPDYWFKLKLESASA